eukprot:CAMPEP_0178943758 /NCGR_PEP_ID=MMETSP0789-20121207/2767_1 /TAXON_ID=3005 /ORGANISM="Rhizosolenia setigera, Strain CCMP 1694" /LENGTH=208 /DNA_ID=CAMNT_0020623393 /DNA_START=273 /DNA_END=899 /DNA_ORIENTATION=-
MVLGVEVRFRTITILFSILVWSLLFIIICAYSNSSLNLFSHHLFTLFTYSRMHNPELNKNPIELVSVGLKDENNVYEWDLMLMGPEATLYEGGFFKARLVFPNTFPSMPPDMYFVSDMWHPNVYADGKVCISILHPPGEDELNTQESADERWRPILGVEQILISVISMLSDPNDDSPANLDAAVMWRNDKKAFKKKVQQIVRKSQEDF